MQKELRLKKSLDFKKAFKKGKRFISPRFALYVCKNPLPNSRIGLSISKAHFKLATRRNRLRRLIKEFFRNEISPHFKGYDFVIASRSGCPHSNIGEAGKELKQLISKSTWQKHG